MNKNKFYTIATVAIILLLSCRLSAQTFTYSKGHEFKKADINFTALANYYKEHPLPLVRKLPFDEDEGARPPRPAVDPAKVHLIHRPVVANSDRSPRVSSLPASPAPSDTFEAVLSQGWEIPPDSHGDVDSQYCVTAINQEVQIQSRTGQVVSSLSLDGFWASVFTGNIPANAGTFDPKIHYDPHYKRWILVTDDNGEAATSQILVAVSATSDPTGDWHMYSALIDATGATWLDFPDMGFNKTWIAVTGNYFANNGNSNYSGAVYFIFDYVSMMNGTGAPFTRVEDQNSFTICPVCTYDSTEENLYALETWYGGSGQLAMFKISGTADAAVVTTVGYPTTTQLWSDGGYNAPQLGNSNAIEDGDSRITGAVYKNHNLWCAHTVFFYDRSSVMWWEIDTNANPVQNGLIDKDDPVAPTFFFYPSIAVNVNNDVLVGCADVSSLTYASGAYSLHMHTDPPDSMRAPLVFRHGQTGYFQTFGGGRNRWGDYSNTVVDPRNDSDFWTIQESVPIAPLNYWDTWWANVQLCPKPSEPVMSVTASSLCIGATALYAFNPIAGATSYQWIIAGQGWSGSSTTDSIYITAGTGTATVTVLAYNSCGEGAAHTFNIFTGVYPVIPSVIDRTQCINSTALYTINNPPADATSYQWTVAGQGWSGSSSVTDSFYVTDGTGTAAVNAVVYNSCGEEAAYIFNTYADDLPPIPSITTITPACIGSPHAVFSAASQGATSFSWQVFGTGWSGSSSSTAFTAVVGTGTGTVVCTTSDDCGTGTPDTIMVTPAEVPASTFSIASHAVLTGTGDVFTYTGLAPASATYTWNFGGGNGIPDTGQGPVTDVWSYPGRKTVSLTVSDSGCSSSYSDTVLVSTNTTGVQSLSTGQFNISILPNPNDGTFDILFDKTINETISVRLIDMQGRIVYTNEFGATSDNKLKVVSANLPSGTYTISVIVDGSIANNKITITR